MLMTKYEMNWALEGDGRFGCACFPQQTESHVAIFCAWKKSHRIYMYNKRKCNERKFLAFRIWCKQPKRKF